MTVCLTTPDPARPQLRNLVLSAFPRNLPPPDPFASKLQVDLIPEICEAPMIQTNYASLIQPQTFKNVSETHSRCNQVKRN